MHKLPISLFFISTVCSAETPTCTDKTLHEHGVIVRAMVAANAKFPSLALRRGWEGKGIVYFEYSNNDLEPKNIKIIKSTNYKVFDDEMVRAIKATNLPVSLCDAGGKYFPVSAPFKFILPPR